MSDERWSIQWVRQYKQFIVEPPIGAEFDNDDWMDLSFDTIREAMDWIDDELRKQPAVDSPVAQVPEVEPEALSLAPAIPPYQPKSERTVQLDDTGEPIRQYSPGEQVQRYGVLNPIADQPLTESQEARLRRYSDMVGLQ